MFKGKRCLQRRWRTRTWRSPLPKAKLSKHFKESSQGWEEGRHIDKDLGNLEEQSEHNMGGRNTDKSLKKTSRNGRYWDKSFFFKNSTYFNYIH